MRDARRVTLKFAWPATPTLIEFEFKNGTTKRVASPRGAHDRQLKWSPGTKALAILLLRACAARDSTTPFVLDKKPAKTLYDLLTATKFTEGSWQSNLFGSEQGGCPTISTILERSKSDTFGPTVRLKANGLRPYDICTLFVADGQPTVDLSARPRVLTTLADAIERLWFGPGKVDEQSLAPELLASWKTELGSASAASERAKQVIDFSEELDRHRHFFGREEVLDRICTSVLRESGPARWVVVKGAPGAGKSAILSKAVTRLTERTTGPPIILQHFFRRGENLWDDLGVAASSLTGQIVEAFPHAFPPEELALEPIEAFPRLLRRASKEPSGRRFVVVLDGVDECKQISQVNPLARLVPPPLPPGVCVICGLQPVPGVVDWLRAQDQLLWIALDEHEWATSNEAACRQYWEHFAPKLEPPLSADELSRAAAWSEGNLLCAVRLREHWASLPAQHRRTELPIGVVGYLQDRLRGASGDGKDPHLIEGLGLICLIRESVPLSLVSDLLSWTEDVAESFLQRARPFLLERRSDAMVPHYRPFHDAEREYVLGTLPPPLKARLHERLVDDLACWPSIDRADMNTQAYAVRHALGHCIAAAARTSIGDLLRDLDFLERHARAVGIDVLLEEISTAMTLFDGNGMPLVIRVLREALVAEAVWLRSDPANLQSQIYNRLICTSWGAGRIQSEFRLAGDRDMLRLAHAVLLEGADNRTVLHHRYPLSILRKGLRDGHVLVGAEDGMLELWDASAGRRLVGFSMHEREITELVVLRGPDRLLSASADGTLILWDYQAGTVLRQLQGHAAGVNGCSVGPAADHVVSVSDDFQVKVWSLADGRLLATLPFHERAVRSCVHLPDVGMFATACLGGRVALWELGSWRLAGVLQGHDRAINACRYLPRARRLLTASDDGTIGLWDLDTRTLVHRFTGHESWVTALAVAPDGEQMVTGADDGSVRAWNVATLESQGEIGRHEAPVTHVAFDTAGWVASSSHDGMIQVWDLGRRAKPRRLAGHTAEVTGLLGAQGRGSLVSASADGRLKAWALSGVSADRFDSCRAPIEACVTAEGGRAVTCHRDGVVALWEITTGRVISTLMGASSAALTCAVSRDGRFVAAGTANGMVHLWSYLDGRLLSAWPAHAARINHLVFHPSDGSLITVSNDLYIKHWDPLTGELLHCTADQKDWVNCCDVAGDGSAVVTGCDDGTTRIWSYPRFEEIQVLKGHRGGVKACRFSREGATIITGSADWTVRVWRRSGVCVHVFQGHTGVVRGVGIDEGGARVASVGEDQTVRIWNLESGILCCKVNGAAYFTCVDVGARGLLLAGDGLGSLWALHHTDETG